ncbi:hypothetical protein C5167_049037 [Papaver somniferum]|uniref:FAD synthase n=1 Tax=Papaver somniferum TaxID=3469 RepID=A0A4Y7KJQ0_PAPSO|nr:FAD synthetase 2, chloroplastic-like [Papaver somniferum]RZC73564.1 hypothetical protein C5167_049037 [Papaver somniferum]
MASRCKISQHLKNCDLGFCSNSPIRRFISTGNRISSFSNSSLKPYRNCIHRISISKLTTSSSSHHRIGFRKPKSAGKSQTITDCFSQQEDDREVPLEGDVVSVAGGIVALGKFDALHVGHRELAIQASKAGTPFLLSFVGMAEVLGWDPRAPVVAKCDRKRVFNSWASYCNDVAPAEFSVEFSSIRHLSPRQFVEKLSKELGVRGVVAGENYRFGYKAAGDVTELVRLCEEYGIEANIVSSVMDTTQSPGITIPTNTKERGQVSSTRVRHALAGGDMKYVSELLGRKHRLKFILPEQGATIIKGKNRISAPKSCLLNLQPKDGSYGNCFLLADDNNMLPCRTVIDSTHIHIESDGNVSWNEVLSQDCRVISIEFDTSLG